MALTNKDIDRMIKVFATKDDIRQIVGRLDALEDMMQNVLKALDRLATAFEKLNLEYVAVSEQLTRHERWIKQIAKRSGVTLSE